MTAPRPDSAVEKCSSRFRISLRAGLETEAGVQVREIGDLDEQQRQRARFAAQRSANRAEELLMGFLRRRRRSDSLHGDAQRKYSVGSIP